MSPPASAGADLAIRALGDGTLLAELTSRSPVVSLAVLALLHSGRLVEAHEAADAVVADARDRGAPMAYAEASLSRALVLLGAGVYHRRGGGCPDGAGPNGMACTRANRGGDVGQLHDRTSRTHRSRERARQGSGDSSASRCSRRRRVRLFGARPTASGDCVTSRRRAKISRQPRRHCRCSATPTRRRFRGDHLPASSPTSAGTRHVGMCLSKKRFASRSAMKCRSPWVSR